EAGSGFPLLVTPGGGLNSRVSNWATAVVNFFDEFKEEFHVITMDQRNANGGESRGPIPVNDPWGAFADDQLVLLDHLGLRDFARACQTPMLVMPDDTPGHPYQVSMDIVALAPKAEVTIYPWKDTPELKQQAVRHVRNFLHAHQPVTSAR